PRISATYRMAPNIHGPRSVRRRVLVLVVVVQVDVRILRLARNRARLQRGDGRAVQHAPVRIEAAAVTGAIPALLGGVPVDLAAEVGALRRQRADLPVAVAVDRQP